MSLRSHSTLLPLLLAAFVGLPGPLRAEPAPTAEETKAQADRAAAEAAYAQMIRDVGGRAPPELEREICRDPWTVKEYLKYLGYPRIAALEQALLADARVAANYADDVLYGRWPEAEPVIARDPFAAATYATRVLCRPWPESEPVIFSCGNATAWYAAVFPSRLTPDARKRMEADPWGATLSAVHAGVRRPDLEPVILRKPEASVHYAEHVLRGRWPEAEAVIAGDAWASEEYADNVVKGRWIQGEDAIAREPEALARYLNIHRVDWPEGAVMLADALVAQSAPDDFSPALLGTPAASARLAKRPGLRAQVFMKVRHWGISKASLPMPPAEDLSAHAEAAVFFAAKTGKRFHAGEPAILKSPMMCVEYAQEVLKARWPEAEPVIARHGEAAARYAGFVMKERWVAAEPAILTNPRAAGDYAAWVFKKPWPEGEAVLATTAYGASRYAVEVLRARWLVGEPVIARSDRAAHYATHLLSERWPEGESAISRDVTRCSEYATRFNLTDWPEACVALTLTQPGWLDQLLEKLPSRKRPELGKLILEAGVDEAVTAYAKHVLAGRWPEGEALLLRKRTPYLAVRYAEEVIRGRWPEAEPFILKSSQADEYAAKVVKGALPAAEAAILESPQRAADYAVNVLKRRWPEAEPVILREWQPTNSYVLALVKERWPEAETTLSRTVSSDLVRYCANIAKARVPLAEQAILSGSSSGVALEYAQRVIRGRWPEGESLILRDPHYAVRYASEILHGRWPEAEPVIIKDPSAASYYAMEVLNARWPEAEAAILNSAGAGGGYVKRFLKGRNAVVEAAILESNSSHHALEYARTILGGAWPDAESIIARRTDHALDYAKLIGRRFPAGETAILRDSNRALEYAKDILKERWPGAEPGIALDAWNAVQYASAVIKGRWPEAESVIARDASASVAYARDALHGRFVPGEPGVILDAELAAEYAVKVLKAPWPEAEPLIIKNREAAKKYAIEAQKRRWLEAEPLIFSDTQNLYAYDQAFPDAVAARVNIDPAVAYDAALRKGTRDAALERVLVKSSYYGMEYARQIIQGRWPEFESAVVGEPETALRYATEVIQGRWPEAEPAILKSPYLASEYAGSVLKARWPEAEATIATKPLAALFYARCVLKARWPAGEAAIRSDAGTAFIYAAEVLSGRWPEAEPVIAADASCAVWYAALVLNGPWPEAERGIFKKGYGPIYAVRALRRRVPEWEGRFFGTTNGNQYSGTYIRAFFREPDKAFEKLLLAQAELRVREHRTDFPELIAYAKDSRKARWPEAEPFLLKGDGCAFEYVRPLFQGKTWPAFEARLRDSLTSDTSRNRIEDTEATISTYAATLGEGERMAPDLEAVLFDRLVRHSPFGYASWPGQYGVGLAHPAFETRFLAEAAKASRERGNYHESPFESLLRKGSHYTLSIRKSRWPELEQLMLELPNVACDHRIYSYPNLRVWPELEAALVASGDKVRLNDYRRSQNPSGFSQRRVIPQEKDDAKLSRDEARILFENPSRAFRYARDVIKGRWPEFEKVFMTRRISSGPFTDGNESGGAFHDTYLNESGQHTGERVASLYFREIVRDPLPEYEPEFAKVTESAVNYALATRCEFPAGEAVILESTMDYVSRNGWARFYSCGLLDDPGAKFDAARLFRGPDGARWCREVLRGEDRLLRNDSRGDSDEPGAYFLRARLENRE